MELQPIAELCTPELSPIASAGLQQIPIFQGGAPPKKSQN